MSKCSRLAEAVISQGLFYLDWLMDHKGEFTLQMGLISHHRVSLKIPILILLGIAPT
jgi:hypothetical protein